MNRHAPYPLIAATLLLALLLGMLALPEMLAAWRPYWIGLVLVYWLLEAPERIGLGLAFLVGLAADLAFGTLIGEQALRLCMLTFIVHRFRARLRFFPIWQQALAVWVLLLNDRLISLAVRIFAGEGVPPVGFWFGPITGALLWPWLYLLLDAVRMRWRQREG